MQAKMERFELRLDPVTIDKVDSWRGAQSDLPSRAEAIRRLVEHGLSSGPDEQSYLLMKLNIMSLGVNDKTLEYLSDAYVYAWYREVYPIDHDGAPWHLPFERHFRVSKDMMSEIFVYLDECWLKKKVPSFYQLEAHYDVRSGRTPWDRGALIGACRYMFLNGSFDDAFWKSLLKKMDHPTEASTIVKEFDRSADIYFN